MAKQGGENKPVIMFHVRVSQSHKDRIVEEARRMGMQMSEYIRYVLLSQWNEQDRDKPHTAKASEAKTAEN